MLWHGCASFGVREERRIWRRLSWRRAWGCGNLFYVGVTGVAACTGARRIVSEPLATTHVTGVTGGILEDPKLPRRLRGRGARLSWPLHKVLTYTSPMHLMLGASHSDLTAETFR